MLISHACVPDKDFSMLEEMVPRLTTFIERARRAKTSIVWVVSIPLVKGSAGGSLGYSFPTELSPQHGEMVVRKSRANAFVGTGLDIALRHRNILTTLVTGIATEGCVDATALGAAHHDLYSVGPRRLCSVFQPGVAPGSSSGPPIPMATAYPPAVFSPTGPGRCQRPKRRCRKALYPLE